MQVGLVVAGRFAAVGCVAEWVCRSVCMWVVDCFGDACATFQHCSGSPG